jgi:hypothetical protein
MKPIPSPLNIVEFALINLEFNFIQPEPQLDIDQEKLFLEYDLDIDFSIHRNDLIRVLIKAEINRASKRLPGYSIFAEVACFFEFNKEVEISVEAKNNIEGFSTIYMALNTLRGVISQVTANAILGRYILPSIDLNDLIEKKKSEFLNGKKK